MASAMPSSSKSSTRIQWMWNASPDPFSKSQPADWKRYSDPENMIIEEAFQAGQKHAILDNYSIDFKHNIQILNSDDNKQRPVQRKMCNRDDHHLREERFTFTPINPKRPFGGLYGWISPFIREVVKDLNITHEQLPSKDASIVPMVVEKAALGIIEEGKKIGKKCEAEHIAKKLRQKKNAGIKEVWECCAHLYSLESFLYKKLNETMQLIGSEEHEQDWRNKVRTLGPFCLLLWDNPSSYKTTKKGTILYRGATLSDEQVSSFQDDCSKVYLPIRSFPSFTSCSRNRAKAAMFGNVLFIMTVKHAFSVDVKPFSEYPDEEEEMLSPGVCFTVDSVENDKNKYLIYLELVQQHRHKDQITSNPSNPDAAATAAHLADLTAAAALADAADANRAADAVRHADARTAACRDARACRDNARTRADAAARAAARLHLDVHAANACVRADAHDDALNCYDRDLAADGGGHLCRDGDSDDWK